MLTKCVEKRRRPQFRIIFKFTSESYCRVEFFPNNYFSNMFKLILFLFSVHMATSFSFQNVQRGALVDDTAFLGQFTNIDQNVVIEANARIGNFVSIGRSTSIGKNTQIGNHANIAQRCIIANDVTISNFVNIGIGTTIGPDCVLSEFANTGNSVRIGNGVKVDKHASISNGAGIQDDSLIDEFSSIGSDAKIGPKVYIGKFASISANAIVNKLAIVHKFVEIPNGYMIKNNEVVIRTPSTYELYQKCAAIGSISDAQVQIASDKSAMPSAQFNAMLRSLLDAPINDVTAKCEQGNMMAKPDLTAIKSLYLIQRYGLERFKETQQKVQQSLNGMANVQMNNEDVYINGFRIESDYHFGEASGDTILERDVKTKFIQLLAIEEEAERGNGPGSQTFCSVTMEIINGQREVMVAKRSGQQNFGNNYIISNNVQLTDFDNSGNNFNWNDDFMGGNFNFNSNLGTNTGFSFNNNNNNRWWN
ncbi:uncharacterized protein LOC129573771 [Sitodiplosis mosellana]|uniref:uncharacterized protein LOC129573771 n=1 Tax=Sitodiplosis mosellana TaxID=263140 RepID=UPI002443B85A|nr:uncharacterized protein LOC129573771 [Sitodiplosis mosellana]